MFSDCVEDNATYGLVAQIILIITADTISANYDLPFVPGMSQLTGLSHA